MTCSSGDSLSWKQELGVAGHMTSAIRKQRWMLLLTLFSPGHLLPTVRVGPLNSVNPTEKFPYRHTQSFVFMVILNFITLTIKANYDSSYTHKKTKDTTPFVFPSSCLIVLLDTRPLMG